MISPLHVVQQVQERQTPRNWLVLHPSRVYGSLASIILGICGGFFFMVYGTLLLAGIFYPSQLHSEDGPFGIPVIVLPMTFLSLLVSGIIAISLATFGKRKSDAVLILMPEGVVSCEHYSNEAKRSYQVIEYANIISIKLEVAHRGLITLVLRYRNRKQENWRISGNYLSRAWIAQRVITDHLRFQSSASGSSPSR